MSVLDVVGLGSDEDISLVDKCFVVLTFFLSEPTRKLVIIIKKKGEFSVQCANN